jgi:hypothetical protein
MNKRTFLIPVSAAFVAAGLAGAGGARTMPGGSKTAGAMQLGFSFAACGGDG